MNRRLQDKVAIVTGASQGIGEATARRFADEGATVVLCARSEDRLAAVVDDITAAGGNAEAAPVDVSDEEAVNAMVAAVVERHGCVDILVNNAVLMVPGTVEHSTTKAWHQNFRVSLDGAFLCTRAVFQPMREHGGGSIVNIASVSGMFATIGTVGYSSAKAAIIQMSRNIALEGARYGIRCNTIAPGAFMTPATEAVLPSDELKQSTARSIPLGRIGDPAECAAAIAFLASEDASFVTGACLVVDGGKTAELSTGGAAWSD